MSPSIYGLGQHNETRSPLRAAKLNGVILDFLCDPVESSQMLPLLLFFQSATYSRDIAPVMALHCNRCHGDEGIAGGLDTRNYESLKQTASLSLLLELVEGRRGESRRMPKEAPPLDASAIAKLRQWIDAGAAKDAEPEAGQLVRRELPTRPQWRIAVQAPGRAYVEIEWRGAEEKLLHREAGAIDGRHEFNARSGSHWPARVTVTVRVRYASGPANIQF